MAIPRVTTSLDKAKENTDLSNLRALNNAVELYSVEQTTGYPAVPTGATDAATAASFATTMISYFPSGIPVPQRDTYAFYYNRGLTSGAKVKLDLKTATLDAAWIRITP